MKGTVFQRPLEFNLHIDGEAWDQGDEIRGSLTVKNHGKESMRLDEVHVSLAHGEFKGVRAKSDAAFAILESRSLPQVDPLAPQGETSFEWKFQTGLNCPITDKSSSLYVLYGRGQSHPLLGALELAMRPYRLIQEFLNTFQIHYRFVLKGLKFNKGQVEAKLAPPDGQAFATLDHVLSRFRVTDETLEIKYAFNVKKIEATAASFDVKKQKKELIQTLAPKQYRTATGRFAHEVLEDSIKDALGLVEAKIMF